jgi:ABC-2 type transport system permease protein
MNPFVTLLRREFWEHPAFVVLPLVVGAALIVLSILAMLPGIGMDSPLNVVIVSLHGIDPASTGAGLTVALLAFLPAFMLPLIFVISFYLLDTLSSERRDRSILFFKSLPVSDLNTVLSKLAAALIVAPALSIAAMIVTQLVVLFLGSAVMIGLGGDAALLWDVGRLISVWVFTLYAAVAFALWYAPSFCFLLAVSAWAKRAVLLWASSPLLLIIVERAITGRSLLAALLTTHMNAFWTTAFTSGLAVSADMSTAEDVNAVISTAGLESMSSLWAVMDPLALFASPSLWIGLAVAAAFTAGAVVLRRYRDPA